MQFCVHIYMFLCPLLVMIQKYFWIKIPNSSQEMLTQKNIYIYLFSLTKALLENVEYLYRRRFPD